VLCWSSVIYLVVEPVSLVVRRDEFGSLQRDDFPTLLCLCKFMEFFETLIYVRSFISSRFHSFLRIAAEGQIRRPPTELQLQQQSIFPLMKRWNTDDIFGWLLWILSFAVVCRCQSLFGRLDNTFFTQSVLNFDFPKTGCSKTNKHLQRRTRI
jgi:hypothetical protein